MWMDPASGIQHPAPQRFSGNTKGFKPHIHKVFQHQGKTKEQLETIHKASLMFQKAARLDTGADCFRANPGDSAWTPDPSATLM